MASTPPPARAAGATADVTVQAGAASTEARARSLAALLRDGAPWLAMAAVPWLVGRVVVVGMLAVAHLLVTHGHPDAATAARVHQGLLGWDAGWYDTIARVGYGGAGHQSLRFWPLLPLLGRAVALLPGVTTAGGVVAVANASALGGIAVVARLVALETGDLAAARRSAWLLAVAPPAFVYVMGYAEGPLLLFAGGSLLALRSRRWWAAAALGVLAGLTRPLGLVLVAPALVEVARPWWEPRWTARTGRGSTRAPAAAGARAPLPAVRSRAGADLAGGVQAGAEPAGRARAGADLAGRAAAVLGPVAGFGAFLAWCGIRYHDALAPIRIQQRSSLHGHLADPLVTVWHDAANLLHGHHLGEGMHVPWVLLALVLLVVAFRRLPASYGMFAAGILVAALSGPNLDSFERYALSAFPLVMAGALLTASARVERLVLVLAVAGLGAYALLAFVNVLVP